MKHLCLQVRHINVPICADYEVQHGCRQSMGQYTLSGVVHRAETPILKVIFISQSVKGASRPSVHSPGWQVEKPPGTDWMNEARMSRKAYSGTWIRLSYSDVYCSMLTRCQRASQLSVGSIYLMWAQSCISSKYFFSLKKKPKQISLYGERCWNRVCHWNRKQQCFPPAAEPQSAWAD